MFFILLLALGAIGLASVSGYFSIWGLAHTFHGVFASVVAMGIAVEFGKLVGISFIYRYWKKAQKLLCVPMIGVVLLCMAITAMGHYGYLTYGYQADILPVKQINEQISLLDAEKTRKLARKAEIDKQIAQLPNDFVRGRVKLIKQFRDEQENVTTRVNEIDKKILDLKTEILDAEAHAGPITTIAKAFGIDTDRASSTLALLLICVFDPMAILLTFAVNVAITDHEKEKRQVVPQPVSFPTERIEPPVALPSVSVPETIPTPAPEAERVPEPTTIAPGAVPPSILKLRQQYSDLCTRSNLTTEEELTKRRVEEQLRHYDAQNPHSR